MQELLNGIGYIAMYLVPVAVIVLTIRKLVKIPDELYRKILHFIMLGAYVPFLFAFNKWWIPVCVALAFILILYPLLRFAAKIPGFSSFVNERKNGEFKSSMVLALGMMAFSITVCWGILNDRYLVLASVYAWGVGDAFAALIGKRFGKHKISFRFADHHKSVEGTLAMFITSALSVFVILLLRGGIGIAGCLLVSVAAALVCAFVELCTNNGFDTVSCPVSAMAVIIPLVKILGG